MPVALRNNKRRSLYITHNVKDLTKEALRPRSWYIPGTNEVAADPYTAATSFVPGIYLSLIHI